MRLTSSFFILLTFLTVTSCIISTKETSTAQLSSSEIVTTESSSQTISSQNAPSISTHQFPNSSVATIISSSSIQNSLISSDIVLSSSSSSLNFSSSLIKQSSSPSVSSSIISSSSQTQDPSPDDLHALREIVLTKQKYFKALSESLDTCDTRECIQAKIEYDSVSLDLKNAVQTATFSSSYLTHQKYTIGTLTPTALSEMISEFTCEDGNTGSSRHDFNYSVSNGNLELSYYRSCRKEYYIGSSTDLFGTWELVRTEEFIDPEWDTNCWWDWHLNRKDTHKISKTLTITSQQIIIDERTDYNCLFDDFILKWNEEYDLPSTKVDCNTYSFDEGDGLSGYITDERVDGVFIESFRYEYGDRHCGWAIETNVNDTTNTVCTSDLPKKPKAERPCTDFFESFCLESQSTINRCKYR